MAGDDGHFDDADSTHGVGVKRTDSSESVSRKRKRGSDSSYTMWSDTSSSAPALKRSKTVSADSRDVLKGYLQIHPVEAPHVIVLDNPESPDTSVSFSVWSASSDASGKMSQAGTDLFVPRQFLSRSWGLEDKIQDWLERIPRPNF